MRPEWMNEDIVKDIPEEKLKFLENMYGTLQGKTGKQITVTILQLLKEANEQKLSFTPEEMNSALTAIKKHSSSEELSRINKLMQEKGIKTDGKL